jgi:hypothetical protein
MTVRIVTISSVSDADLRHSTVNLLLVLVIMFCPALARSDPAIAAANSYQPHFKPPNAAFVRIVRR